MVDNVTTCPVPPAETMLHEMVDLGVVLINMENGSNSAPP